MQDWPEKIEDTPALVREYWPYREELNVQKGVVYEGERVIIPELLRKELSDLVHYTPFGAEACLRPARENL